MPAFALKFGSLTLEHVLKAPIESVWEEVEHPAPYRATAYRGEKWSLGRTVKVDGEIREVTRDDAATKLHGLRALSDGEGRLLFEYAETSLYAILGDVAWSINVENGWFEGGYIIAYTATFLECNPP